MGVAPPSFNSPAQFTVRASSVPPSAEVFLPLPVPREQIKIAYEFRTTWLASSLSALRERGHGDRYFSELPRKYHSLVESSVVGEWVPIEVAMAHYEACERLGLSNAEITEISTTVTQRVHGSTLHVITRLAKQAGLTPWTLLGQLHRLWDRVWVGGGVCVYKLGPKEALVEIVGWPLARYGYIRVALPAMAWGLTELFARKVFSHNVPEHAGDDCAGIRLSWV